MGRFGLSLAIIAFIVVIAVSCSDRIVDPGPPQPSQTAQCSEKQFIANQYFWLTAVNGTFVDTAGQDYCVLPNFRENYRHYANRMHLAADRPIEHVELFKSIMPPSQVPDSTMIIGRAAAMQFYADLSSREFPEDHNHGSAYWKRLRIEDGDFEVDRYLGTVRLRQPLTPGQMLGCVFSMEDGNGLQADTFGVWDPHMDSVALVLLCSGDLSPTDSTWNLMFRHVYSMQAVNLNSNTVHAVFRRLHSYGTSDGTGIPIQGFCPREVGEGCTYLSFFSFDYERGGGASGTDGYIDDYPSLVDWDRGELQFLDLTPFDPSGYWNAPTVNGVNDSTYFVRWPLAALEQATGDTAGFRAPYLYDHRPTQYSMQEDRWRFEFEFYE
jgi:hypothetical protein